MKTISISVRYKNRYFRKIVILCSGNRLISDEMARGHSRVRCSTEEFARRKRLFTRYYGPSLSDLTNLGLDKQVERLDALLTAYQGPARANGLASAAEIGEEFVAGSRRAAGAHQRLFRTRVPGAQESDHEAARGRESCHWDEIFASTCIR